MEGKYRVNYGWIQHPRWSPAARLTLRASLHTNGTTDPSAAKTALNDFLATLRPAWITVDGRPELVAYDGGAWVGLEPSPDPSSPCPVVLISATGEEAVDWITALAGELHDAVTDALPGTEFRWEELEPRPFGRAG
ncbi:MAG TPA: hypothetical protein GX743_00105 [Actinomycetales bacterium]|nr:hypothetical protein [Actinomycetales bacterium]